MRRAFLLFLSALFILWVNYAFGQNTETVSQGEVRSFTAQGGTSWTYYWILQYPGGNLLSLSSTSIETEEITLDQVGTYTLQVQATDDFGCLTEWETKTIIVENNVPLQAVNDTVSAEINTPLVINILENDLGLLNSTQVNIPAISNEGGEIFDSGDGTITYIPAPGYWGEDFFTYQLCTEDGLECNEAIVSIDVRNTIFENADPLAVNDINLTWENTPVSGNVLTNDLIFKKLPEEVRVVTIPDSSTGKLTSFDRETGDYTFEPATGFTGEAVFQYEVCTENTDGESQCSSANVSIQILSPDDVNRSPIANDDVVVIGQDSIAKGNLLQNDFDPDMEDISISEVVEDGLHGTLNWSSEGNYTFVPEVGFIGETHFNYQLCDPNGNCEWATVSIHVLPSALVQKGLYANDDAFYSKGKISGDLTENDFNQTGSNLIYNMIPVTDARYGSVLIEPNGTFTYIPNMGVTDQISDQFVYEVCNMDGSICSQATVYIVADIPELLVAVEDTFTIGECLPVILDASLSSGAGDLTFSWSPTEYLNDPASSSPVFTPGVSTDFTLTVSDEYLNTSSHEVHVEVVPAPQIVTDNQVFVQSASEVIMLDASASTGSELAFDWWSAQAGVVISGGDTSNPQVNGIGKYYVRVTDSYGCTALDSVIVGLYIQVKANNDTVSTMVNTSVDINVLRNDISTGEIDPLSINIVTIPEHGNAYVSADSIITYAPDQHYVGQDNFIYQVCNYTQECDEATVMVMVNNENLFIPDAFSPNADGYNDYFEILGLGAYENVSFRVFNRWGNLVFESDNYGESGDGFWDGIANRGVRAGNGQVPTGTYFYVLDLGHGYESLSGFIYIDR